MIELRASAASTWLTCSLQATMKMIAAPDDSSEEQPVMDKPTHVATQLGSMVHEQLTGQPAPKAKGIAFDAITRNQKEMALQASIMVEAIIEKMAGVRILHREKELEVIANINKNQVKVTGHIDLLIEERNGTITIVDIKTGRMDQRSAWAQMAIYTWLMKQKGLNCERAIILWTPRGKMEKCHAHKSYIELFSRPSSVLLPLAEDIIKHVARAYSNPMAVPGGHCVYCENIECAFNPEQDLTG